jgi:hypothetical protein
MASFRYQPLEQSDEIRVLDLMPGVGNSEVECKIRHAQLSDNPDYEAVSYCWGDANDICHIHSDDCEIQVTRNLYNFLLCYRYTDRTRTVSADAICIDQTNLAERSSQVRLMGEIYSKAKVVLAWLGTAREESNAAIKLAKHRLGSVKSALVGSRLEPGFVRRVPTETGR